MRTEQEIVARIESEKSKMFSFVGEALFQFLSFDVAKPMLKEGITEEQWRESQAPCTRERVLQELREYMEFAWGKAHDHRGLSANRSVDKLSAWVWLLGDDETVAKVEATDYPNYGAPKLKVICDAYGFPIPDDEATQNMIAGRPCEPGCGQGCGQ